MVTDTLQEYEALLQSGFTEEQARALIQLHSPARTDPEVLSRLDRMEQSFVRIEQRFDAQDRVLAEHSRVLEEHSQALQMAVSQIGVLSVHVNNLDQRVTDLGGHVTDLRSEVRDVNADLRKIQDEQAELRAGQHVIEERVKMEGRVSRMINAALIPLAAIAATLISIFAR